jgi:hypothetical protein
MTWLELEEVGISLPAPGDGFAGISIFDISVFEFRDTVGAGDDCVSVLPLESVRLWPHAARNKLSKLVTMTRRNSLLK